MSMSPQTHTRLDHYIPMDRRQAIAQKQPLPTHTEGAVLLADISGFTKLTDTLVSLHGPRRGAEEITRHINQVFSALNIEVDAYRGSIVVYSGDAITCWFDGDDGSRALSAAQRMQAAMEAFSQIELAPDRSISIELKTAVAVGKVNRLQLGDPTIQLLDTISGEAVNRLTDILAHAQKGKTLVDLATVQRLGEQVSIQQSFPAEQYAIMSEITEAPFMPWPDISPNALADIELQPWVFSSIFHRIQRGEGNFISEIRPVVALFLNFKGIDYQGDPDAAQKLDAYIRWIQQKLVQHEATLMNLTIDEKGSYIYISFGAPVAHHDDALRAALVATDIRVTPAEFDYIQAVHIGLSQGKMQVGSYGGSTSQTYSAIGTEVNLAARLMQLADAGSILISERMANQIEMRFTLHKQAPVAIKGFSEPITLYKIDREKSLVERLSSFQQQIHPESPLVGRAQEYQTIQAQLAQIAPKTAGNVILEGEPGMGKSRIVEEVIRNAQTAQQVPLVGAADSIRLRTLYLAWQNIFIQGLNLANTLADPAAALKALEEEVVRLLGGTDASGQDARRMIPLVGSVMPFPIPDNAYTGRLTGQVRAETTRAFLADILQAVSLERPIVVILDDAQWMDSASWALAARVSQLPSLVMILVTRPMREVAPPEFHQIAQMEQTDHLILGALSADSIEALILFQLGVKEIPQEVVSLIAEKSEGNPFFIEELTYSLRDSEMLQIEGDHALLADNAPDLSTLVFPDTIEGVVTQRIDLLRAEEKLLIKVASVIGRIFAYRTLHDIHPLEVVDEELRSELKDLEKLELTLLDSPDPELQYLFKHIIIQEVAYNLMLFSQRRQLHQQIAEWYEQNYQTNLAPHYPLLAHHWTKVATHVPVEPGVVTKAVDYLFKAGQQALQNYANFEASSHFRQALELLRQLPEDEQRDSLELNIQTMHAFALVFQRGYGDKELERTYARARDLSENAPDTPQLGFILYGIYSFHSSRAEYDFAMPVADHIISVGRNIDDSAALSVGLQSKALVHLLNGDHTTALPMLEESYALAESTDDAKFFAYGGDFRGYTGTWIALNLTLQGKIDQGQAAFERALAVTADTPYAQSFVLAFGGIPYIQRDMDALMARSTQLLAHADQYSFLLLGIMARIHQAWAMAQQGQAAQALGMLSQIMGVPRFAKLDSYLPWFLAIHTEVFMAADQDEEAQKTLDEAFQYAAQAGGSFYLPELHRLQGDLHQRQNLPAADIETAYRTGLDLANQQGAYWWSLRVGTALATYLQTQGRSSDALALLEPVLAKIEGGESTADVKAAQALVNLLANR